MRVAILCGGRGMRLNGGQTPKALAEVHDQPLVEHVMNIYGRQDFVLLLGHLNDQVRLRYMLHPRREVEILDTGRDAETGARVRTARKLLTDSNASYFSVAYCDCLADIKVWDVVKFHQQHRKIATLVAVPAVSQYGVLGLDSDEVTAFREKPRTANWVNFGFFVFSQGIFDYLDDGPLEGRTMEMLVADRQLRAYKHDGWHASVDSPKDLERLNKLEGSPWLKASH